MDRVSRELHGAAGGCHSAQIGAQHGERSPERVTYRNGYRNRTWDTRVGTMELHIPKLREGSYFPSLLEPRRRSENSGRISRFSRSCGLLDHSFCQWDTGKAKARMSRRSGRSDLGKRPWVASWHLCSCW